MPDNLKTIRNAVGRGLTQAGLTRKATLIVVTQGTRDPQALSAGRNPTEESVSCRGLVIRWNRKRLNATDVQAQDRVVLLVGKSLGTKEPKVGDRIAIEAKTSRIVDIERDPAAATFACLTRS